VAGEQHIGQAAARTGVVVQVQDTAAGRLQAAAQLIVGVVEEVRGKAGGGHGG